MLDIVLYGLVAAFVAWEGVAHFYSHNTFMHTFSDRIRWLETRGGWPVRIVVFLAVIFLGLDLEGVL